MADITKLQSLKINVLSQEQYKNTVRDPNEIYLINDIEELDVATQAKDGLLSSEDKIKLDNISESADAVSFTPSLTSGAKVGTIRINDTDTDLYAPTQVSYTLPSAGTTLGGVKSGGDVTISGGVITVNDDSHNHVIANVDGLQTALEGKSPSGHTHTAADVGALPNTTKIPSKTSEITNDSGFITSNDIPEGAAASPTTPKMDGTASVGIELAFARGDHVHPSDTSRVPTSRTINTKPLTSNITLTAADVSALPNTTVIPTKTSQLTNDSGFKTTDNNTTYSIGKSGNTVTLSGSDGSSSTFEDANTVYTHPSTHLASIITQDTTHRFVSDTEKTNWNSAKTHADSAHAPSGAEVNQNAYSNVAVSGQTTIAADSKTDTLNVASSGRITLTTNATTDTLTIGVTDQTSVSGNAGTATKLQTARKINGVNFDGSADITITANPNTHTHVATDVTQDTTHRFVTDTEKSTWNSKASTAVATTTANGLMASGDKTKLNGIAENANNYTHPASHPSTMITGLGSAATMNIGTTSGTVATGNHTHADKADLVSNKVKPSQASSAVTNIASTIGLIASYEGMCLKCTNNAVMTVIIPANVLTVGCEIEFIQFGAGSVMFNPENGVTLYSKDGARSIDAQYGIAVLKQVDTNIWILAGDLG